MKETTISIQNFTPKINCKEDHRFVNIGFVIMLDIIKGCQLRSESGGCTVVA